MGKKHKNIIESLLEGFSNNDVYNDEASGVPIGFEDNDDQVFVDPFEIHDDDEDDDYEYGDEDDEDYYIDSPLKFNGCANNMDEAYDDDDEREERFQNLVDTDPVEVVFLLHDIEEDDEDEDDEKSYSVSKLDEDYIDIDIKTIGKFNKNADKNKDKKN